MTKTLTITETKIVFDFLILKKGETTSLDVKKKLRKMDFFAIQSDVSRFLNTLTDGNSDYSIGDNGEYKTYSFQVNEIEEQDDSVEIDEEDDADDAQDMKDWESASLADYDDNLVVNFIPTKVEAEFIFYVASMVKGNFNDTDWVVFNANGNCEYHIFNGDISRDRVRSKYASTNNVKIQEVRAKRFSRFNK